MQPSQHDTEAEPASEWSPLLHDDNQSTPTRIEQQDAASSSKHQTSTIAVICLLAFVMMFGDNLQAAAILPIQEATICDEYYASQAPSVDGRDCKAIPVQKELALLRGYQQLVPVFSGLLCTIPYALLAGRIGRRPVVLLSGAGSLAALSWTMAVLYWRWVPARWILASGAWLFIGGGDAVMSSMLHVIVTDVTSQANRAQIFLFLHAADVLSGFFGPAVAAVFMDKGYAWTPLVLAQLMLFLGAFVLTRCIPETLAIKKQKSSLPAATARPQKHHMKWLNTALYYIKEAFRPLTEITKMSPSILLLLVVFMPQTTARELFSTIGLQYSNARYSLSYARGSALLSLFQGTQGVFAIVLLPLITRTIAKPLGWTAWTRDRYYSILSIALVSAGLWVIGFAPTVPVQIAGLFLITLGSCATGLLMTLLGEIASPNQVSLLYSTALTLSLISRSVSGPVVSGLLAKGIEMGGAWTGIPFMAMATLMLGISIASVFIPREYDQNIREELE